MAPQHKTITTSMLQKKRIVRTRLLFRSILLTTRLQNIFSPIKRILLVHSIRMYGELNYLHFKCCAVLCCRFAIQMWKEPKEKRNSTRMSCVRVACCACSIFSSSHFSSTRPTKRSTYNRNGYETCFKFVRVEMLLFCHRVIQIATHFTLASWITVMQRVPSGKCTRRGSNLYVTTVHIE